MYIGIFSKTFVRPSLGAVLDAVVAHGLPAVQFNLTCAGLPSLPDIIEPAVARTIRAELAARAVSMAAVSGTFNMIHPAITQRQDNLRRLGVLIAACRDLGTSVVTLCTGTRDPHNMWQRHPDNDTPQAWADMLISVKAAVKMAEAHGVTLGVETEVSNVVDSAVKARRLLDEVGSPNLKIIMDGANLFHAGELPHMHAVLDEAFALLGRDIVLAHAKDLTQDGAAGHDAAGHGVLDYPYYVRLLKAAGYSGPLILHSLDESQVEGCIEFLQAKLAEV